MAEQIDLREPGRAGPYSWEPVPHAPREWIVRRDGVPKESRTYTKGHIEQECQALWRREKEIAAALASSDPLELCRTGWHRHASAADRGAYFRWMGSGKVGVRLNYWVGREPIEWTATKIAGLGKDARPWLCAVCGSDVPNDREGD